MEKAKIKPKFSQEHMEQIQQKLALLTEKLAQSQESEELLKKKLLSLDVERDDLEENYCNLER